MIEKEVLNNPSHNTGFAFAYCISFRKKFAKITGSKTDSIYRTS